jgi:hypothetical protein
LKNSIDFITEFCTYSYQQCENIYIDRFSDAKFIGKIQGIKYGKQPYSLINY